MSEAKSNSSTNEVSPKSPSPVRFNVFSQLGFVISTALFIAVLFWLSDSGVIPLRAFLEGEREWRLIAAIGVQGLILMLVGLAILRAIGWQRRLAAETDYATCVVIDARNRIKRIRGKVDLPLDISKVPDTWPISLHESLLAISICQEIHDDAQDGHFGSKEGILQRFRDELDRRIAGLLVLPRAVLHLGILGTFLGLFFAMPAISELTLIGNQSITLQKSTNEPTGSTAENSSMQMDATDLGSAFERLFGSLRTCFSTSIVGMIAWLYTWFLLMSVFRRQEVCYSALSQSASATLALCRNAINNNQVTRTLSQMNSRLGDVTESLDAQTSRLRLQTEAIEEGMKGIHMARANLDSFLHGVSAMQQHVLSAVDKVEQRLTSEEMVGQINDHMQAAFDSASHRIRDSISSVAQSLDESCKSLKTANTCLDLNSDMVKHHAERRHEELAEAGNQLRQISAEAGEALRAHGNTLSREIAGILEEINDAIKGASSRGSQEREELLQARKEFSEIHSRAISSIESQQKAFLTNLNNHDQSFSQLSSGFIEKMQHLSSDNDLLEAVDALKQDVHKLLESEFEDVKQELRGVFAGQHIAQAVQRGMTDLDKTLKNRMPIQNGRSSIRQVAEDFLDRFRAPRKPR